MISGAESAADLFNAASWVFKSGRRRENPFRQGKEAGG